MLWSQIWLLTGDDATFKALGEALTDLSMINYSHPRLMGLACTGLFDIIRDHSSTRLPRSEGEILMMGSVHHQHVGPKHTPVDEVGSSSPNHVVRLHTWPHIIFTRHVLARLPSDCDCNRQSYARAHDLRSADPRCRWCKNCFGTWDPHMILRLCSCLRDKSAPTHLKRWSVGRLDGSPRTPLDGIGGEDFLGMGEPNHACEVVLSFDWIAVI